jgi:hypothetical protein
MPERVDDPSIGDDEVLWRRINPDWIQVEVDGTVRPKSMAFVDRRSQELSVHIASIMADPNLALHDRPDDSLAAIRAGHPRSLGYAIVRDPKPDDPSHALICVSTAQGETGKITQGDARKIAKQAVWVVLRAASSS